MKWKNIIRFLIVCCIAVIMYILNLLPDKEILSTSFTILGIFFSVGIGTIVAIELNEIKNIVILENIKKGIDNLVRIFVVYFAISTIFYIIGEKCLERIGTNLINVSSVSIDIYKAIVCLSFSFIIIVTIYMYKNFIELRKLKDDIIKKNR